MSKDLFADLLSSANGNKPKKTNLASLSLSERLNSSSSSLSNNNNSNNWVDGLDLLSNNGSSSSYSNSNVNLNVTGGNSNVNGSNTNVNNFTNGSNSIINSTPLTSTSTSNSASTNKPDEFEMLFDVFNKPSPQPQQQQQPQTQQPSMSPESQNMSQTSSQIKLSQRDHAVAELLDMGFPIDKVNQALDSTSSGDDINGAITYLMNAAHGKTTPAKTNHRQNRYDYDNDDDNYRNNAYDEYGDSGYANSGRSSNHNVSEDLGAMVNDLSNQFMSKASFLFQTGRKKLQDGMEMYRNQQFEKNDNMPVWMKNQQKYKNKAKQTHPDDEGSEEMDYESMKRIVEEQRMRSKKLYEEKRRDQGQRQSQNNMFSDDLQYTPPPVQKTSSKFDEIPTRRRTTASSNSRSATPQTPSTPSATEDLISLSQSSAIAAPAPERPVVPDRLLSPDEALEQMFGAPSASAPSSPATSSMSSRPGSVRASQMYTSSSRRSGTARPKVSSLNLPTVPISPQQQSSFNDARSKATDYFKNGDFSTALTYYQNCLSALPKGHILTIIAFSNLCIVQLKLGNSKDALETSNTALSLIDSICQGDYNALAGYDIEESKSLKSLWLKILSKKGDACEHLEKYQDALDAYNQIVEYGGSSKPVMDGRRRCMDVLQPKPKPKPTPKATPKPTRPSSSLRSAPITPSNSSNEAVNRVKAQNAKEESLKNEKFELHDTVEAQLTAWRGGKEDNLRALLSSLQTILWSEANWKPVTIADLVMDRKVKMTYMKAVAKTHPDKVGDVSTEKKLIAQGVFVTLNQAWDKFKEMNNIQ